MPNTNRRHLKKIYYLEFLDTCEKWSQHLNASSLRFFVGFFFSSGEQPLQESQQKVRFEKLPLLTTLSVIQCTGRFILPSLLVRTQICCFPRTLNEQKHSPCEFRHGLYIRVKTPCLLVVPATTWVLSQPLPCCYWLGRKAPSLTVKNCSWNLWIPHLNSYY